MRAKGWLKRLKKDVEHTGGMKTTIPAVTLLILEGHTRQTPKLVKWKFGPSPGWIAPSCKRNLLTGLQ